MACSDSKKLGETFTSQIISLFYREFRRNSILGVLMNEQSLLENYPNKFR